LLTRFDIPEYGTAEGKVLGIEMRFWRRLCLGNFSIKGRKERVIRELVKYELHCR